MHINTVFTLDLSDASFITIYKRNHGKRTILQYQYRYKKSMSSKWSCGLFGEDHRVVVTIFTLHLTVSSLKLIGQL